MKSSYLAFCISGFLALTACDAADDAPAPPILDRPTLAKASPPPEPAQSALDAASTALKAEKWVKSVSYTPGANPAWVLGTESDGTSRYGLAEVACMILREAGATNTATVVRIADVAKQLENDDRRFDGASLGSVECKTGNRVEFGPSEPYFQS